MVSTGDERVVHIFTLLGLEILIITIHIYLLSLSPSLYAHPQLMIGMRRMSTLDRHRA